jgi:hypothetical protein
MKNYEEQEEEARRKLKKKTKMKVSGKSVFLLSKQGNKDKKKK